MIISDEQAHAAAVYLRTSHGASGPIECHVPSDVIARACEAASAAPDTRPDRVEEARARLSGTVPDAGEVASKMLSRIVSDSLR